MLSLQPWWFVQLPQKKPGIVFWKRNQCTGLLTPENLHTDLEDLKIVRGEKWPWRIKETVATSHNKSKAEDGRPPTSRLSMSTCLTWEVHKFDGDKCAGLGAMPQIVWSNLRDWHFHFLFSLVFRQIVWILHLLLLLLHHGIPAKAHGTCWAGPPEVRSKRCPCLWAAPSSLLLPFLTAISSPVGVLSQALMRCDQQSCRKSSHSQRY